MTLPASSAISLQDAATEFGISAPIILPDSFWGKPGMPVSGAITLPNDFWGKSNVTFSHASGTYSDFKLDDGAASITITCNVDATWTWSKTGSTVGHSASIASGGSGTTFTVSQTPPVGTSGGVRSSTWTVTATAGGVTRNYTLICGAERTATEP